MTKREGSKKGLSKKATKNISIALFVLAGILLIIAITLSIRQHQANSIAIKKAINNPAAPKTNKPTESSFEAYTVAPDLPRYIFIPSINVKAMVGSVGLTSGGAIGTPDNVYNTAWYNGSSKPGQPGAMLIDGHVSSWTADGVFYNLKKLKSGEVIQIQRGDGLVITYDVVKSVTYPYNAVDMTAALAPVNSTKPGLNLISCTGDLIKGTSEFNARIVVFAQQISTTEPLISS